MLRQRSRAEWDSSSGQFIYPRLIHSSLFPLTTKGEARLPGNAIRHPPLPSRENGEISAPKPLFHEKITKKGMVEMPYFTQINQVINTTINFVSFGFSIAFHPHFSFLSNASFAPLDRSSQKRHHRPA